QHRGLELGVVQEVGAIERHAADVGAVIAAERDHEGARVGLAGLLLAPPNPDRGHQLTLARASRRACASETVLRSSIATVIGPTPPGTGVSQPATGSTLARSTSPISLPSTGVVPTSMTKAPGLTYDESTIPGRPIAATRMSASRQTDGRFWVRE